MDQLKSEYYHQTLDHEQNNLNFILSKVATIVRAEVDIHERIYTKGLADPLLEAVSIFANEYTILLIMLYNLVTLFLYSTH